MSITRTLGLVAALAISLSACGGSAEADVAPVPAESDPVANTDEVVTEPAGTDAVIAEDTSDDAPEPMAEETAEDDVVEATEADAEPQVELAWPIAPAESGCTPGTTDTLPDGHWLGYAVGVADGAVEFDLACVWWIEDLFAAGLIDEIASPGAEIVNDNATIRSLPIADGATANSLDQGGEPTEWDLANWGEGHTSLGMVGCPSDVCFVRVSVIGGEVVELREIYLA